MPRESPYLIQLTGAERLQLESLARKYTSPYNAVVRAKTVLLASQGLPNDQIAAHLSLPRQIVSKWRKRFFEERLAGLDDQPRAGRPPLFPPEVVVQVKVLARELAEAQWLLDQGGRVPQISAQLNLLPTTVHKALDDGRLRGAKTEVCAEAALSESASSRSQRSAADQQAALGVATTRLKERLLTSLGQLAAGPIRFEPAADVPQGGVLCALPALLVLGSLHDRSEHFTLPPGYYPLETIFLSVAFLALARVPSLEALRYEPPGEWGWLLGLDRIPEVRTPRDKLGVLCAEGAPVRPWSSTLAREWMEAQPQSAGTLYIDEHVRVYHGHLTELPRAGSVSLPSVSQWATHVSVLPASGGFISIPAIVIVSGSVPGKLAKTLVALGRRGSSGATGPKSDAVICGK